MKVRIWQVGIIDKKNPSNSVIPTNKRIKRLKKAITKLINGKVQDIIIGPEVKIHEMEIE